MPELVPNLPLLLNRLSEGTLEHDLASAFQDTETEEEARKRLRRILERLVETRREEVADED